MPLGTPQLTILCFLQELEHKNNETFNKLSYLTTMTSRLSKCLNEELVLKKYEKTKKKLPKNIKK